MRRESRNRPGRARTYGAGVLLLAVLVGGCARPEQVPGTAAPVTRAATGTPTTTPTPSRPAPVRSPSGTPVPPEAYGTYRLDRLGLVAELPVPADWSLKSTERGVDLGDPTGNALLRIEIVPREASTALEIWAVAETGFRARLKDYRRLGLAEVPGIGDSAADLTFTFTDAREVTRRAIDRGVVVGELAVAVYYSAPLDLYDRMAPVFDRASRDIRLS